MDKLDVEHFHRDRAARLRLVQCRAELTPRDPAAASRARRVMAAADKAVREVISPAFDGREAVLGLAEAAEAGGVNDARALAAALRDWRDRDAD